MSSVPEKVSRCETIIGYIFGNKSNCVNALYAFTGACCDFGAFRIVNKNDKLAILGDVILQYHLCQRWQRLGLSRGNITRLCMNQEVTGNIGEWTSIIQETGSNTELARVGRLHGLDACVVLNPGTTSVSARTMATTIEAVIAAVKIDGDDAAVEQVLGRLGLIHELLQLVTLQNSARP